MREGRSCPPPPEEPPAPRAVSRAAGAREGVWVGGAGADGGRVGAEACAGGVGGGGEVTRRRFCGAAGLVLGGNGLTRPDLLGPLPVSGYQVDPAFR